MLILVDQITQRMTYTFDFIFKQRDIPYSLTTSVLKFEEYNDFKRLNYSSHNVDNTKGISPSLLLRQSSILPVKVKKTISLNEECLCIDGVDDIVASIFYVLTRYEEYLCDDFDQYDRFPCRKSILFTEDWVKKAVCDRWSKAIIEFINPDLYIDTALALSLNTQGFKIVPTFDIDNTYAYKYKTGKRKLLSKIRDILQLNGARLKERKTVEQGGRDPYDTFEEIRAIGKGFSATKVFWLVKSDGEKDRNLSIEVAEHQALIQDVGNDIEVGLHPSFSSFNNVSAILKEREKLERVLKGEVKLSRQHFLRFKIPTTFHALIAAGFNHEYSMGFAEHIGFRCGTARVHAWFDLSRNENTELLIHPFAYMDGTLNEYMQLSIDESKAAILELFEEVKRFGGDFVFIWHNETIGDYGRWKGWSEVLHYTLNLKR